MKLSFIETIILIVISHAIVFVPVWLLIQLLAVTGILDSIAYHE